MSLETIVIWVLIACIWLLIITDHFQAKRLDILSARIDALLSRLPQETGK